MPDLAQTLFLQHGKNLSQGIQMLIDNDYMKIALEEAQKALEKR